MVLFLVCIEKMNLGSISFHINDMNYNYGHNHYQFILDYFSFHLKYNYESKRSAVVSKKR